MLPEHGSGCRQNPCPHFPLLNGLPYKWWEGPDSGMGISHHGSVRNLLSYGGSPLRYAEVVVASENSVHKLLELLPGKILNGDKVEVRLATRQNLSQFEAQARKRKLRQVRLWVWEGVLGVQGRETPSGPWRS